MAEARGARSSVPKRHMELNGSQIGPKRPSPPLARDGVKTGWQGQAHGIRPWAIRSRRTLPSTNSTIHPQQLWTRGPGSQGSVWGRSGPRGPRGVGKQKAAWRAAKHHERAPATDVASTITALIRHLVGRLSGVPRRFFFFFFALSMPRSWRHLAGVRPSGGPSGRPFGVVCGGVPHPCF